MYFFFFSSRRRHTRWPRDWSSDVCSSDLGVEQLVNAREVRLGLGGALPGAGVVGLGRLDRLYRGAAPLLRGRQQLLGALEVVVAQVGVAVPQDVGRSPAGVDAGLVEVVGDG